VHLIASADNGLDNVGTISYPDFSRGGHSFEVWSWMSSVEASSRFIYPSGWYDRSWGTNSHYTQRNIKPGDPVWRVEGASLNPNLKRTRSLRSAGEASSRISRTSSIPREC